MKPKFLITLIIILVALSLNAMKSGELYQKISSAYKSISSYQAKVTQTNYFAELKSTINYTGNMYFTPGRLLMHFDKPSTQRMLIEKGKFTLYDAGSNTIYTSEIVEQYQRMNPLELLQLYWGRSTVSVKKGKGELMTVDLKPKKDAMLTSISATVNSKTGIIQALSYKAHSGNTVKYSFSGIKINQAIAASVWNFQYPKDAQRITD
ncbi:MAG TPA: outer membrane lipoprotein carrier protein LolA [Candidatus Cloacimonadota bacterium]|nr:outer membrane lipoprotein carrier protein LolA [Candidatus Cloacimonadota bacterium]